MSVPIFIISLENAKTRQRAIEAQIQDLDFNFFPASDGRNLTSKDSLLADRLKPENIAGKKGRKMQRLARLYPSLLPGEIGCYLSHYRLLTKIWEEKIPITIILEDDIIVAKNFSALITQFEAIPYRWDIIRLCGLRDRKFTPIMVFADLDISEQYSLVQLANTACGTQGYIVTYQGARKLLSLLEVMYRPVDITIDYYWQKNISLYAIQPYPICPGDTPSMIDQHQGERMALKQKNLGFKKIQLLWLKHRKSFLKRRAIRKHRPQLKTNP